MTCPALQGTWTAKGAESGTVFDEIDLSNESGNEWSDYDEKVCLFRAVAIFLTADGTFLRARLELLSRSWSLRPKLREHRYAISLWLAAHIV